MNWQGVHQSSREKVESLVNAFNAFIIENHKASTTQDQRINHEWQQFKQLIQQSPADTDSHNKFVLTLRNTLLKEDVSKRKAYDRTGQHRVREVRERIKIDKTKLLAISKELKRAILRNTENPLDMLC